MFTSTTLESLLESLTAAARKKGLNEALGHRPQASAKKPCPDCVAAVPAIYPRWWPSPKLQAQFVGQRRH